MHSLRECTPIGDYIYMNIKVESAGPPYEADLEVLKRYFRPRDLFKHVFKTGQDQS